MEFKEITEGLPAALTSNLLPGESIYYFTYLPGDLIYGNTGGCLGSERSKDWIGFSKKRVFYEFPVYGQSGAYPLSKKSQFLNENNMGKQLIKLVDQNWSLKYLIPTVEKGNEIRKVFLQLIEQLSENE